MLLRHKVDLDALDGTQERAFDQSNAHPSEELLDLRVFTDARGQNLFVKVGQADQERVPVRVAEQATR